MWPVAYRHQVGPIPDQCMKNLSCSRFVVAPMTIGLRAFPGREGCQLSSVRHGRIALGSGRGPLARKVAR